MIRQGFMLGNQSVNIIWCCLSVTTNVANPSSHHIFSFSRGQSSWLYIVPWGIRRLIQWISKTYNNPPIYITENGVSDGTGTLDDQMRIEYYKNYINEVLKGNSTSISDQYIWDPNHCCLILLCLPSRHDNVGSTLK